MVSEEGPCFDPQRTIKVIEYCTQRIPWFGAKLKDLSDIRDWAHCTRRGKKERWVERDTWRLRDKRLPHKLPQCCTLVSVPMAGKAEQHGGMHPKLRGHMCREARVTKYPVKGKTTVSWAVHHTHRQIHTPFLPCEVQRYYAAAADIGLKPQRGGH